VFNHILVPTDFSVYSDAALEYARAIAAQFRSTLHLLHVIDAQLVAGPPGSEIYIGESAELHAELFDNAKDRLAQRAARPAGAPFTVTTEVIVGTSAPAIIDVAAGRGIDLIVMGTHGRTGLAHLLMGSVAERVVRFAPCPVLTIRNAPAAPPRSVQFAREAVPG
jgi:nucleotide-binding universal stress UspA family protein